MFDLLLGFVVGALFGWNVLPQPKVVSDFIAKLKARISG